MTLKRVKIFTLLFGAAVFVHLTSYNLWRMIEDEQKQMYVYCVLNSLTHISYSVIVYYFSSYIYSKLKSQHTYGLRLFAIDWCLFGALDLYNQITRNYDSQLTWQWIGFFLVIVFDIYHISKWKYKQNPNK